MTEKETPTPKDADEETVESTVWALCDRHDKRLFEDLDKLHSRGMHDTAVLRALRKGGYADTADAYFQWMHDGEPATPAPAGMTGEQWARQEYLDALGASAQASAVAEANAQAQQDSL